MKKRDYILTNKMIEPVAAGLYPVKMSGGMQLYVSDQAICRDLDEMMIVIDGYVLPRNDVFRTYKELNQFELIEILYKKHGQEFVKYIKGSFVILIMLEQKTEIYTDQLGIKTLFYCDTVPEKAFTNNISLFHCAGIHIEPDSVSMAIKSLLNRVPGKFTIFVNIFKTKGATQIEVYQHKTQVSQYWNCKEFLNQTIHKHQENSFEQFAELLKMNFNNLTEFLKPSSHVITLTGGKDSRTGLSILKSLGIEPTGFTYGNPDSRDAVFARKLSDAVEIPHHIISTPLSGEWYQNVSDDIIGLNNPEISLFRAHRVHAFSGISEKMKQPSILYAGYLGGELLMGIYYDNLIFTDFLTNYWKNGDWSEINPKLEKCFHRSYAGLKDQIIQRLSVLHTLNGKLKQREKEYFSLFEIGIPHHSQDVFLSEKYFNYAYPFYLDVDFFEALFLSRFSLFFTNNKTVNLLSRYKLYEFNLKIQHHLAPQLDRIPFGKRGSYTTDEFLKGKLYWSFVKTLRYIFQGNKFPPNYAYNTYFRNFIMKQLHDIHADSNNILNQHYNIPEAINGMNAIQGNTSESVMHPYVNIAQLNLQLKKYRS
jgi:hypothetical protein